MSDLRNESGTDRQRHNQDGHNTDGQKYGDGQRGGQSEAGTIHLSDASGSNLRQTGKMSQVRDESGAGNGCIEGFNDTPDADAGQQCDVGAGIGAGNN